MDDKLSIRLNIADRFYPLKVDRGEEEQLRKAAKFINDRITKYKLKYTSKDIQDIMSMVILEVVNKNFELEAKLDEMPIINQISEINEELESYLENTY